jgi:Divergent InlB B-repeat domain
LSRASIIGALALAPAAAAPASASAGQALVITHPTPGGGVVTSDPPGLSCETFFCGAEFAQGSLVTLTATPRKGFAFAGYTDACKGPACSLTMDSEKRVTVSFVRFSELPYSKPRQVRKDGTAVLTIRVGGPGRLVLTGPDVKRQVSEPRTASNVKLPVVGKGAVGKRMETNGTASVDVKVAYTPTEGTRSSLSRSVQLIRGAR